MPRRTALPVVLVLAACGVFVPVPRPDCDSTQFIPPPALSCEAGVAAALDALPSHGPITAVSFQYGGLCPPNARCPPPQGSEGTVIVTFGDGTQVAVYVQLEGGQLVAAPPVSYPPWAED